MNEIREQAERIRDLMGQLEDANKKLRQPGAMSDISSQGSAPSPPAAFSISPSSTTYQSLDGINTTSDSETNKNITDWISKAKESFAEFDVFLNGGAGAPQSYFEDRDAEDSPVEDDVDNLDDDDDDYEFAVVASDGEDMSGNAMKSSRVRRSSRSSVGSNLTRGSASGRKQEVTKKSAMVPNEAVPFGLMANLSIRKTRQRGASAEVEDVGVANDGFFASKSVVLYYRSLLYRLVPQVRVPGPLVPVRMRCPPSWLEASSRHQKPKSSSACCTFHRFSKSSVLTYHGQLFRPNEPVTIFV